MHHSCISHTARYTPQADSFYTMRVRSSWFNVFEFNILNDTCRTTTGTDAVEMLGSGSPAAGGGGQGWWAASTIL